MRMHTHALPRCAGAAALAAVLAWAPRAGAQAPRPHGIDDWMTVTRVTSFTWAPDGRAFFYTSNAAESGVDEIFRVPAAGGAGVQLSRTPAGTRAEPRENLVVSADGSTLFFTQSRYFQNIDNVFSLPAAGGEARQLTFNDAILETAPAPAPDGSRVAFFSRTARGSKIFLLDLNGIAWPRMLDPGARTERDPVWSPDGTRIAFWRDGDTWVMPVAGGEAKRVTSGEYGAVGSPVWSPDGTRMLVSSGASGFAQLAVVDVASGALTALTYGQAETSDASWSPDGRSVVYIVNDGLGMSRQVMLAAADGRSPARALTRGTAIRRLPQFSPDGRTLAYLETAGNRAPDIWTIPAEGGAPRQVTNSMGRIDPASLSVPEEVTYPGPDNLAIPALLYKPKGFDPSRRYPVIVLLHGHPGQWNHAMDPEWQYFVERGYVLIAPNPRGSMGFGQGFHDLHVGDYGGTEYEDIMNVLKFLERQPYIDMTRKATWGGSGGGYMSFWISTQAPTTFQAQVIRAPVSSWKWLAMERYVSPSRFATPTRDPGRAREEFGGAYTDIPERYDERSPLTYIDRVRVPQLLMHGQRDSSVPPNESRRWVAGLESLGRRGQIAYVEYPDEDHTLKRYRATVRDKLLRMEAFFAEHLRLPAPAPAR